MLQGVDRNWRQTSVFYLAPSLISGGGLLVNYQRSIFYIGNPNLYSKELRIIQELRTFLSSLTKKRECHGWDSNPGHSDYNADVLTTEPF